MLNTEQFQKLDSDPTKTNENKMQTALRKIKSSLSPKEYKKLYPTGSNAGKFYATAKVHKLKPDDSVNGLPLRPIVSSIGTTSYHIAKYLAKLLSPLARNQYTVNNTKHFINDIRHINIPIEYTMVSFDVSSLFTNVPLDLTIDIILRRIYDENQIETSIKRKDMKELLLLCTKNVHFTFNGEFYVQLDGVAMGSPLGPVIAGIFMTELEKHTLPFLSNDLTFWRRYVDDTICFIKKTSIKATLDKINAFHPNIKFTYEIENESTLPFLDVLLIRNDTCLSSTVYRKPTNSDIYLHWQSFTPLRWKQGTLRTLVLRAHTICSNKEFLNKELTHLRKVFNEYNGYPHWLITKVFNETSKEHQTHNTNTEVVTNAKKKCMMILPYQGEKGLTLVNRLKKDLNSKLPAELETQIVFTGKRLSTFFQIKDKIMPGNQHNVIYKVSCPEPECNETYVGECERRITERIKDHSGRDHDSHVVAHTVSKNHKGISMNDFKIIGKRYNTNYKRKIGEALYIKEIRPSLNKMNQSVPLKLFS